MKSQPLLEVRDLKVHYPAGQGFFQKQGVLKAVDGVSFEVARESSFGLVGESGSGKSTIAQAIMRLVSVTSGSIKLSGQDLTSLSGSQLRKARRSFQMIFQDPYSTLNPRQRGGAIIQEPLNLMKVGSKSFREERVAKLLEAVGLPQESASYFPHQFSGGQRQRLMIARALSTSPEIIVCDEPVSALDVAIQAQILNVIRNLKREMGLTTIFISHDLGVIQYVCDYVGVMYLGQLVETAPAEELFTAPRHPYSWALMAAAVPPGPLRQALKKRFALVGEPASPLNPPEGCRLAERCLLAEEACRCEKSRPVSGGHFSACRLADQVQREGQAIVAAEGQFSGRAMAA